MVKVEPEPVSEAVKETVEVFDGTVVKDEQEPPKKAKPKAKVKVKAKKKTGPKEEKVPDSFVVASGNIKERKAVETSIDLAKTVCHGNGVDPKDMEGYDDESLSKMPIEQLKEALIKLEELADESVPF